MKRLNETKTDTPRDQAGVQFALARVLRLCTAVSLFLMMIVTFVDVVGRYFHAPIYGAAEMIQFLLAILIFSGLGLATAGDTHIRVDLLDGSLDRMIGRKTRGYFLGLCHVIGTGLIAWQLARLAVQGLKHDRRSIVLEWPEAWVILAAAVFVAIAVIFELTGFRTAPEPSDVQKETS